MNRNIIQSCIGRYDAKTNSKLIDEVPACKILHIASCKSIKCAVELLKGKDFCEHFKRDKTCFVVVIEIDESLCSLEALDVLDEICDAQKPMIVSFESKDDSEDNVIYWKEINENCLVKMSARESCSELLEDDGLNVTFNLEFLLRALRSGTGGHFNGKFLETTVNIQQRFSEMRFIDRAAFTNNVTCLKFLRLFDFNLAEATTENLKLMEIAAKSCDFQGFLALLDLPFDCEISKFVHAIESLDYLHNSQNFNLLMTASESGNAEAVNLLLKCSYDINELRNLNETAAGLAWQKGNYEIFITLLNENSLFPKNFIEKLKKEKERGKVKKVFQLINDLRALHESIKKGRIDQVKSFLMKNPATRHAYNIKNESAAATALKSEQFGIYEMLISEGVCLGPHEDISEILGSQEETGCRDGRRLMMKKIYLHEMHKKFFKEPFEKHLMMLLSHSFIGFDIPTSEQRSYFKFIKEAYEILNQIEGVSLILKVVAKSKFFRVIFDFNRESIDLIDPTTCKNTKGTSYFKSGYIYVGAKGLLSEELKHEVLSTLAHELTHYAMQLVYENDCRPYRDRDFKLLKEFETIATLCEFKKEEERKIFYVFNYPKLHQHAELIVRVPQLLVLYMKEPQKLENCVKAFPELFEFFHSKIVVDVRNEVPLMMAKRETTDLNDWLGVIQPLLSSKINLKAENLNINFTSSGILLLVSNCVKLTVKAIYQQLQRDSKFKVESLFVFARTSAVENEKTKDLLIKALNLITKPTVVFECDDDVSLDKLQSVTESLKATERIVFVVKAEGDGRFQTQTFSTINVKHLWNDFQPETQDILWNFNVIFQGKEIKLHDLMTIPSKALEEIPFCDLLRQKLQISDPLKFNELDFFIERKFLAQSNEELNFDSVSENRKLILMSDDPGAGKTTAFKMIALKLKEKFPSRWVVFVDLKKFIDVFEQNELADFTGKVKVAKFLGEKIVNLENFELELFHQLFNDNRVILLMDGIDEICPNYKDFIVQLLKAVKSFSTNQLWISTRPHLVNHLSQELNEEHVQLKPFTSIEQHNFYYKFYEHRNIATCDLDRYVKAIEKLMSFLSKNHLFWSTITNDIISNPLFMRIAAEIYDDEAIQQTKSGKCFTLCNLYLIYERFIEKKFSLWMRKGRLSIGDQIEIHRSSKSVLRCHLKVALEQTFNDSKVNSLVEESNLTDEQIFRVGLTTYTGFKLQFMHRTFAEFFIADFLFKNIFMPDKSSSKCRKSLKENRVVMRLFVRVLTSDEYQMIRAFLGNALELEKNKRDAKRFTLLAKLFRKESRRFERDNILKVAVNDGCVNLTTLVLQFSVTSQNALRKFVHKEKRDLNNVLMNSMQIHRSNVDTIKSLWDAAKSVYSCKAVKSFLLKADGSGRNLLHILATSENHELLNFLLNEVKAVTDRREFKDFLLLADDDGRIALEVVAKTNGNKKSLEAVWLFYEKSLTDLEQEALLKDVTNKSFEEFCDTYESIEEVLVEVWKTLRNKSLDDGRLRV